MKVIFLQDVPNVARAGEIKEVANGYAKNFLIPKKLALLATPSTISLLETQHKLKARNQEQEETRLIELAHQLEGKEINLKARAGAKDRLYGSITTADIASELNNAGFAIDKRKIELAEPIHQLGSYEIPVRLAKDITPRIKVIVIGEEAEVAEEMEEKKKTKAAKKTEKKERTEAVKEVEEEKETEVAKETEKKKATRKKATKKKTEQKETD